MPIVLVYVITLFMQGYESQPYEVVASFEELEIRYYPSVKMVQTESNVASNQNFNRLFRYISGANKNNQKIAMTTPVHMQNDNGKQRMAFVLPASFNKNPPLPASQEIQIVSSKAGYFAAIRFGGYSNRERVSHYTKLLRQYLQRHQIESIDSPILLGYNSPYKFFNRRNEIIIEVAYQNPKK